MDKKNETKNSRIITNVQRSGYRQYKEIERPWIPHPSDLEWRWDPLEATTEVQMANNSFEIIFHPNSSQGTGAVRGNIPFVRGHIYYWEIEVIGSTTATDIIVGVGTQDFDLKGSENKYCSLIGSDNKSWGYSYMGLKRHDGKGWLYGQRFNTLSIIGVRLDMWRGTLEFFYNRSPLGVAFKNLAKEDLLYPMVCSTACRTKCTVKYCRSVPFCLQICCLEILESSKDKSSIPPGLMKMASENWWIAKSCSS